MVPSVAAGEVAGLARWASGWSSTRDSSTRTTTAARAGRPTSTSGSGTRPSKSSSARERAHSSRSATARTTR